MVTSIHLYRNVTYYDTFIIRYVCNVTLYGIGFEKVEGMTSKKTYGISEQEVHGAMDRLFAKLKTRPSIKAIRGETKTGSDSTISRYAKTWNPYPDVGYSIPESEKADPELEAVFQAAVERRVLDATEQLEADLKLAREDRDTLTETASDQESQIKELSLEVDRLTALSNSKQGEIVQLIASVAESKNDADLARKEGNRIREALASSEARLERLEKLETLSQGLEEELKAARLMIVSGEEAKAERLRLEGVIQELRRSVEDERFQRIIKLLETRGS